MLHNDACPPSPQAHYRDWGRMQFARSVLVLHNMVSRRRRWGPQPPGSALTAQLQPLLRAVCFKSQAGKVLIAVPLALKPPCRPTRGGGRWMTWSC